jgi:hypothetical protein
MPSLKSVQAYDFPLVSRRLARDGENADPIAPEASFRAIRPTMAGKEPLRLKRKTNTRPTQGFFASQRTADRRTLLRLKKRPPEGKMKMMKAFPPGVPSFSQTGTLDDVTAT